MTNLGSMDPTLISDGMVAMQTKETTGANPAAVSVYAKNNLSTVNPIVLNQNYNSEKVFSTQMMRTPPSQTSIRSYGSQYLDDPVPFRTNV
mgnify:CR=1 FL=1